MAIRANPNWPWRTINGRVYERFKPISEWRQEDNHVSLLVYLPGFQKEFIRVTTEYRNILRVRGECPTAENKWRRFHEDFEVPKTCKMNGIRAKFDAGVLTIIMPMKILDAPITTETTLKSREPTKREKQDRDSAKSSSSTLDAALLSPQPMTEPPLDHDGKGDAIIKKNNRGSSKKTKRYSNKHDEYYKRVVKVLAKGGMMKDWVVVISMGMVAVAFGVYVYHASNGSLNNGN